MKLALVSCGSVITLPSDSLGAILSRNYILNITLNISHIKDFGRMKPEEVLSKDDS